MPFTLTPTLEEVRYPKVNTYADLLAAGDHTGEIYIVLTATGVWGINRKRTGMWRSDGVIWTRLGIAPTAEQLGAVEGNAPSGYQTVKKIFVNPANGKLKIIYDDTPIP